MKWLKKLFSIFSKGKKKVVDYPTGVMNARDVYTCDECKKSITRQELDATWDWSGPHCPHCGFGGMSMFSSIVEQDCPEGISGSKR